MAHSAAHIQSVARRTACSRAGERCPSPRSTGSPRLPHHPWPHASRSHPARSLPRGGHSCTCGWSGSCVPALAHPGHTLGCAPHSRSVNFVLLLLRSPVAPPLCGHHNAPQSQAWLRPGTMAPGTALRSTTLEAALPSMSSGSAESAAFCLTRCCSARANPPSRSSHVSIYIRMYALRCGPRQTLHRPLLVRISAHGWPRQSRDTGCRQATPTRRRRPDDRLQRPSMASAFCARALQARLAPPAPGGSFLRLCCLRTFPSPSLVRSFIIPPRHLPKHVLIAQAHVSGRSPNSRFWSLAPKACATLLTTRSCCHFSPLSPISLQGVHPGRPA